MNSFLGAKDVAGSGAGRVKGDGKLQDRILVETKRISNKGLSYGLKLATLHKAQRQAQFNFNTSEAILALVFDTVVHPQLDSRFYVLPERLFRKLLIDAGVKDV